MDFGPKLLKVKRNNSVLPGKSLKLKDMLQRQRIYRCVCVTELNEDISLTFGKVYLTSFSLVLLIYNIKWAGVLRSSWGRLGHKKRVKETVFNHVLFRELASWIKALWPFSSQTTDCVTLSLYETALESLDVQGRLIMKKLAKHSTFFKKYVPKSLSACWTVRGIKRARII